MHTVLRLLIVALIIAGGVTDAVADEPKGTIYLTGGITMPYQSGPSGVSTQTYLTPSGGVTQGWSFGGGVRVASGLSVEAEWSTTGWMTAREPSRYGMTFNEERRERYVSIAARLYLWTIDAVQVEPVVGIALTRPEAWSQTEWYRSYGLPQQELVIDPKVRVALGRGFGPMVGADVAFGHGRVALLPSFRLVMPNVSDSSHHYPGAYPELTLRAGLGVRVNVASR